MSTTFKEIRNTLDNVMKERTCAGIKGRPECDVVTENHEQILWKKGILGESNPDQLRRTIFFLYGLWFGLCGGQEHSELQCYPDCQINIIQIEGKDALIYCEYYSKTRQGGIADRTPKDPKVCYAFCSGYCPRCFIELF